MEFQHVVGASMAVPKFLFIRMLRAGTLLADTRLVVETYDDTYASSLEGTSTRKFINLIGGLG
jgi:hypothetical protein